MPDKARLEKSTPKSLGPKHVETLKGDFLKGFLVIHNADSPIPDSLQPFSGGSSGENRFEIPAIGLS